jgi:phospholipid/cholesterol/gamma-HCH transport system substrate-binding protein
MKITTSQKIKTGIFTIVGILIFIAAIFIIGNNKNMFGNTFHLFATFNNVGGLQIGNNIHFAGIKVGTIENISFVSDTIIRVDMRMAADVKPFLKRDAIATVASSGLMGDKILNIIPGSDFERQLINEGDQMASVNPVGMDEIIAKFTKVADNTGIITNELAAMALQIREGDGSISKLLYTNTLSNSLEGTAANAQRMTASLAGISAKINAGEGSLGSLLNTNALSNRVDQVMITTDSAVGSIKNAADGLSENMKAMQSSFLFRGYFKRKAKEAGKQADSLNAVLEIEDDDFDFTEEELEEMVREAQKALDEKRKKKVG